MSKICISCWEPTWNSFRKYCYTCFTTSAAKWKSSFQSTRIKGKPLNPKSEKKINRLKIEGKETDVFDKVYKNQEWKCLLTWKLVVNPWVECYPHLLNKWTYPLLRLYENNIVLVANWDLHETVDQIIDRMKKEIWSKELENKIKRWESLCDLILYYLKTFF